MEKDLVEKPEKTKEEKSSTPTDDDIEDEWTSDIQDLEKEIQAQQKTSFLN